MVRRSTPQKKIDERAFPVRIRVSVPPRGLGQQLMDVQAWLQTEIGGGQFAIHSSGTIGTDAIAIYFRDLEGAQDLVHAFPALELADQTQSLPYTSPAQSLLWEGTELFGVCNLYSHTKGPAAIREFTKAMTDSTGNLPPLPAIYPDMMAPVVRNTKQGRDLSMLRWGMPSPAFALKNRKTDRGVTNVRNTKSPHWRRWLGEEYRCVVPFTSFAENDQRPGHNKELVWFALDETRPMAFFAGVWTTWTSVRKLKDGETTDDLYGFLTTAPNDVVRPVHPKAMPVILRTPEEIEAWMTLPTAEALALQKPLPDGTLQVVARGPREDNPDDLGPVG